MLVPSNNKKSSFVNSLFTKMAAEDVLLNPLAAPNATPEPVPETQPDPNTPITEETHLSSSLRKKINNQLYAISTHNAATYYQEIPMDKVSAALKQNGVTLLDEDNTPLKMVILTGRDGRATFNLAMNGQRIKNSMLAIQWHKMDMSGKYEFNVYLS